MGVMAFQFTSNSTFCSIVCSLYIKENIRGPRSWASCQIRKIAGAHALGMPGTFSPTPEASDPDMHHGTCVTHVPWCMPGSLTNPLYSATRKNVPGIPGACATRRGNVTYLVRGPWPFVRGVHRGLVDSPNKGPVMEKTILLHDIIMPHPKAYVGAKALKIRGMHGDVIKWKHFPRYWPFVRGIHRSPVNSPHKGQWHGALMFSFICVWINGLANNGEAGDLRRYCAHYDVTVMVQVWVITTGLLRIKMSWCDIPGKQS